MVTMYVKPEGLDTVTNVIADMAARSVNTRPLMGRIGNIMLLSVTRNFEEEGRPGKWQPLSELTKEIYEDRLAQRVQGTKGYTRLKGAASRLRMQGRYVATHGGKLLQREGDLRKSITIGKVDNTSIVIGSPLVYARIHQLGGDIVPKKAQALLIPYAGGYLKLKRVHIPARPYLVLQDEDGTYIVKATKDYLLEAADRAKSGGKG